MSERGRSLPIVLDSDLAPASLAATALKWPVNICNKRQVATPDSLLKDACFSFIKGLPPFSVAIQFSVSHLLMANKCLSPGSAYRAVWSMPIFDSPIACICCGASIPK